MLRPIFVSSLPRSSLYKTLTLTSVRLSLHARCLSSHISESVKEPVLKHDNSIKILNRSYPTDSVTNVSQSIIPKTSRKLHLIPNHPLNTVKRRIEDHFSSYATFDSLDPVVTLEQNFDSLLFEKDHPGRAPTDTYYVNKDQVLRTHTSAHQSDVLRGRTSTGYLITADVYRRDEIDTSHYPVFHQMEGIKLFDRNDIEAQAGLKAAHDGIKGAILSSTNTIQEHHTQREAELVDLHLRHSLEGMVRDLFREEKDLEIRWIEGYFPFTSPSWEMEVLYRGKWLELLGCGVMQQKILDDAGNSDRVGWAFGLGLERIAMVMYDIPDIRLFWSTDPRFLSQFESNKITKFRPFSKYPTCYKDLSFWCTDSFHENDFTEIVRDVAGDLAEDVKLIDQFTHPKTKRVSRCFRINYRSMDRTFTNEEVDAIQDQVRDRVASDLGVELR
ncbi:hypothetical protein DFS34DRAFT_648091 [Phlyctochytrium arcticum]|nr:hypothetical protein DFS34DRAFT_648091 [Phlyctochytrium arcticum]